ncbi:complement C1q tumor necrosis factor-related protein 2 [Callorhinchus milii]|uniref:C1q and TNF related 2 n=1 Tax=Callorhinchus milii TaxID=7868 RepID=V9KWA7_CALMI|nr:complement C1q tumor necrosis factor-related protein 2 [Callorhinchus milii]|eukprot:gi/632976531/ref/XP_007904847.1/ PREDICTED: complement C1q tumor necrosis factor-related protein 2 [Callorhinchus milii]
MMLWLVLLACTVPCAANQLPMDQAKPFMRLGSAQVSCSVAGSRGAVGSPGVTGAPGTIGRMGFPGKDGADGKDGQKGEKGDEGARGKPGISGKPGVNGIRGAIGKAGPRGPKGFAGDPGTPGVDGPKGGAGVRGEPGIPGICKCGMNLARCAFSVAITRSYPRERMPIKFDKILLNEGGFYNSSSGKFICGIPGIYYFSYDITLSNKHLAIGLVHNGQYHIRTFDANTGNHDVASASTIIYLKSQDEVWLQIFYSEQNGLFYDPHWADSLFTGFLLYVDQDYLNEVEAQQFL